MPGILSSRGLTLLALLTLLSLASLCAPADAAVVEEVLHLPAKVVDRFGKEVRQDIVVTVWRDDAMRQPYPVLLLNHGRATTDRARAALGRARYSSNARWFARLGFLVAVPTRIGYGATGGPDVEDSGACGSKVYGPAYAAAADQSQQVLEALQQRPDTAKDQTVIVGQSFGGATSIALAARNPASVKLAINFAGGGGGSPETSPQRPCLPGNMERVFESYGRTARVPTLWIYTENDMYFGPAHPKEWFAAFQAAGGVGRHVLFPPQGADGHSLFTSAPELWRAQVVEALRRAGIRLNLPE